MKKETKLKDKVKELETKVKKLEDKLNKKNEFNRSTYKSIHHDHEVNPPWDGNYYTPERWNGWD